MLIKSNNYEKNDFKYFVEYELWHENESKIYGAYEYFVNGYFGHYANTIRIHDISSTGTYSGTVDGAGNVSLRENYSSDYYNVEVYRRDLNSLNDELLRYAEYCRHWVTCLHEYLNRQIENYENTGKYDNPQVPEMYDAVHCLISEKLNTDPAYAVECKKKVERFYKILGYSHPWYNGEYVWYHFVSSITSEEEQELINFYNKSKKKKDNTFWAKREELHFKYLDRQLSSNPNLNFTSVKPSEHTNKKNPLKSFWFIASIIAITFYVLVLFGLPEAIKEIDQKADTTQYILYYAGTTAVFTPAFVIFVIKLIRYKKWKKATIR